MADSTEQWFEPSDFKDHYVPSCQGILVRVVRVGTLNYTAKLRPLTLSSGVD